MLVEFLRENRDIFAWQPADMKGVPRELTEHNLNIDPKCKPVKQPLRRFGDEKRRAIGKDTARLLKARFIQVIDSTAGSELLCFLDAYSGYHQIKMRKSDQLATSFTTPYDTFCYVTMPFGLKKRRCYLQQAMQCCLHDQIGRNVHAYVDDIVVMSKKSNDLISD